VTQREPAQSLERKQRLREAQKRENSSRGFRNYLELVLTYIPCVLETINKVALPSCQHPAIILADYAIILPTRMIEKTTFMAGIIYLKNQRIIRVILLR
jgi:hypothetical protein